MTNLRRPAIHPAPQLAVENYPATDTRAERDADDSFATNCRSLPHLANCRRVRIVLEIAGRSSCSVSAAASRNPSRHGTFGAVTTEPSSTLMVPGTTRRQPRSQRRILLEFVNGSNNRVNNRVRVFDLRRVLFEPRLDSSLLVDHPCTQVCPTRTKRRKSASSSRLSAAPVPFPHNPLCFNISPPFNTHRQPNKLSHGPGERRRRTGSCTKAKTRRLDSPFRSHTCSGIIRPSFANPARVSNRFRAATISPAASSYSPRSPSTVSRDARPHCAHRSFRR